MQNLTATYSPEDNKLRLYASSRLDKELYDRVRAAGFIWAPKQSLFVAPMWTPSRNDLLIELCGEIDDEDTSLVARQIERAERFDGYSNKRSLDASRAAENVKTLTDGIPQGQPILIGHRSQRRAEKDAQRIENGMKHAIKMWETSKYWTDRAEGALAHAKYKEKPEVRARRIKKLGAEMRKHERNIKESQTALALWNLKNLTIEKARVIAGHTNYGFYMGWKEGDDRSRPYKPSTYDVLKEDRPNHIAPRTLQEVVEAANIVYPRSIAFQRRWVEHYQNRIAYETAMLNEQGAGSLLDKKSRPKQLPLCNYKTDFVTVRALYSNPPEMLEVIEMTKAEYAALYENYRGTKIDLNGTHRIRVVILHKDRNGQRFNEWGGKFFAVFLTDQKVVEAPAFVPTSTPVQASTGA